MYKFIVSVLFLLLTVNVYASGNFEEDRQSQALLYRQKRTSWAGAPENSVFYECYLVVRNSQNINNIVLLDTYITNNNENIENNVLLINPETSMGIRVTNAREIFTQENVIYKCTVLYLISILGTASINVFSAEPINNQIGYVFNIQNYNYYLDNDEKEYLDFIFSDNYGIPYRNNVIIGLVQNDVIGRYFNNRTLFVYLPKRKILQINQWSNIIVFNSINIIPIIEARYNEINAGIENLNTSLYDNVNNRQFTNNEIIEIKNEIRNNINNIYNRMLTYFR